jgi:hypothetical protein
MYTADLIAAHLRDERNGLLVVQGVLMPIARNGAAKPRGPTFCSKEPHRSRLTQRERELLFAWMDSNGVYFGTWDYTKAGPRSKPFLDAVEARQRRNEEAGCAACHADAKGEIKRFDQWINLDAPEMSRVLRAPLPVSETAEEAASGWRSAATASGSELQPQGPDLRVRYAHSGQRAGQLPPRRPGPKPGPPEGKPVTPFASVSDPHYRKLLGVIRDGARGSAGRAARGHAGAPTGWARAFTRAAPGRSFPAAAGAASRGGRRR